MSRSILLLFINLISISLYSQILKYKGKEFETHNVTAVLEKLNGEQVIRVERDLKAFPFDVKNMGKTVDEPTFIKLKGLDFIDGTIEVKVLSKIKDPSPFENARGFIGVAFRINESISSFEAIYLRPSLGRAKNQFSRNHSIQYFSYPDYKFDTLRKSSPGMYETAAPIALNEWITMRIEINGQEAELFLNDAKYSNFIVDKMKGTNNSGSIALWIDIGTIGYFKDLKITKR